jgi:2Fe-2S ferredoxin
MKECAVKIIFVGSQGVEHIASATEGETGMRCATSHAVSGIEGECSGAMACGTCHVYVDDAWLAKLPLPSAQEQDMLSGCIGTQPNSRLSCQIRLTAKLNGMKLRVPDSQT